MTQHKIKIDCDDPKPKKTKVGDGDDVEIRNKTGAQVEIVFLQPDVFDPPVEVPLVLATDGTRTLTVGDIGNGTEFVYPGCSTPAVPRNGRIDPN